ncbi:MAG: ATP-binding cassette domain-containing protein [Phycisphaerae bacterium]|nr:ATP-binding cassette domain-containing protein [Phycisphaerae bacterium]
MENKNTILSVKDLCKYFPVYGKGFFTRITGYIKAVDNISFDLFEGETFGLVGESGCGKTTAARTILRALSPTAGRVIFKTGDTVVDLASMPENLLKSFRPKMQMIFQDPFSSLNPRMTVGNIVGEPLVIHKMAKGRQLTDRVKQLLARVGLSSEYINRYPHAFSGGQRQRIGIARALIMYPSLIIADEAVSALDVSVQAQILNLLMDIQDEFNLTYIFVSHNLGVIRCICDRVAVMYAGRIVEMAATEELFRNPLHPYTKALLSAIPYPDLDIKLNAVLTGETIDLAELPHGCNFESRCPYRTTDCLCCVPELKKVDDNHFVACLLKN